MLDFRVGFGYDVHPVSAERPLWLGGVKIADNYGLQGHSDADVLIHSICDALLGSLALGDIGKHFPDTDNQFKNIDSKILLSKTFQLIAEKGYRVNNIDCTVVLEKPKIAPFIPEMQSVLAKILNTETDRISIKATTNEKLGFIGRLEGAAAYCIASLTKNRM